MTDKIYREGVEKGNEKAQKLVENAQEEAKKIIDNANKEADAIIAAGKKTSNELIDNTKSELKLFANQTVNALKSEITNVITDRLVNEAVNNFTNDKNSLNAFIVALASKWIYLASR